MLLDIYGGIATGHKEDTILRWMRETAQHAEQVEEVLMADFEVKRGQLDALWTCVGNRGKKGATQRQRKKESSGVLWIPTPLTGRS